MVKKRKPEFLSFRCADKKGDAPDCKGCPVKEAGYCDDFVGFLSNYTKKILQSEQNGFGTNDVQDCNIIVDAFYEALIIVEKKLPDYPLNSSFPGWLYTIISNKELDRLRNYSVKAVSLEKIAEKLEDCEILAGKDLQKKMRYAFIPKDIHKVSSSAPSLIVLNGFDKEKIKVVASMPRMALLSVGAPKPGKDIIKMFEANEGGLLWYKSLTNIHELKRTVDAFCRKYDNVITFSELETANEGEHNYEIEDNTWQEKMDASCSEEAVKKCLEKLQTISSLAKCAAFILTFIDIEKSLEKLTNYPNYSFKSGTIKRKVIYEEMIKIQGKSMAAIKRQHLRCRKRIGPAMKNCLERGV